MTAPREVGDVPTAEEPNASGRSWIEPIPRESPRFEIFSGYRGWPEVEQLPVGAWVGISGAAVGTGMGYKTSLSLSFLTGFFNVRLGYWWDSYIRPRNRGTAAQSGRLSALARGLGWLFPVQAYLLQEWMARFHGPGRRLWNLSDGGHVENTGAYELVRRRLPLIIALDNGEDSNWRFEDVGNLVRKIRVDLGAHLVFVESKDPILEAPPWIQDMLTGAKLVPFRDLQPAKAERPDQRVSQGYAALARITFDEGKDDESWLVLVKPTLLGTEPVDLLEYRNRNEAFPQESTADQFFDEAQWESYRRLGQCAGESLFGEY